MSARDLPSAPAPLTIAFDCYEPGDERRRESLFALGNGLLFMRASAWWVTSPDRTSYPGTYRAGLYDDRIVCVDGTTRGHASLVNLPNTLPLSIQIHDASGDPEERLSPSTCTVLAYRHSLDLAAGITARDVLFRDAQGRRTWLRERRLVNLARAPLAARCLTVVPENWSGSVTLRASLDGDVANANTQPASLRPYRHLDVVTSGQSNAGTLLLTARLRNSGCWIAAASGTTIDGSAPDDAHAETEPRAAHLTVIRPVAAGVPLRIETLAALGDGNTRDEADGFCRAARDAVPGFETLAAEQARAWGEVWPRVGIDAAEPRLRRALAFHSFHLLQTVSPLTAQVDVGLPSRGWQEAYHGQIFWDAIFAFPFLNHRFPEIARGLLLYRYRRLPAARRAARETGHAGAMYPWRSAASGGEETPSLQPNPLTGTWSADHTRLQRHVGAAIAHDVWHYVLATGDAAFLAGYGAEMLVEIARFFASLASHDPQDDRYNIRGVIGPDEYHNAYPGAAEPGLDNNAYTNVMAAACLGWAGKALARLEPVRRSELAQILDLGEDEPRLWARVASRLRLCFGVDGVLSQFAGYDALKPLDAGAFSKMHPEGRLDHVLEAQGDTVDAYQASKQGDVLMLFYLLQPDDLRCLINGMGYAMDEDALRWTVAHYLDRISHESSLSHMVCAGALAWIDPERSWRFFEKSLMIDLDPQNSASACEGLHLGAMAGSLDVLQRHYLGLRLQDDILELNPAPPSALAPVRMCLLHRDATLHLSWDGTHVVLRSDSANPFAIPVRAGGRLRDLEPGDMIRLLPVSMLGSGIREIST